MAAFDAALREYFLGRPDVEMAFLFGSYAQGLEHEQSDVDIAVYFTPPEGVVEWESDREFPADFDIGLAIERITQLETDIVVLNSCPSTLADTILREGRPLAMRNTDLHTRFLLMVSDEAENFRRDAFQVWDMKDELIGYDDARRLRLTRTRDFIRQELSHRHLFASMDMAAYRDDPRMRLSVERWVENLVNASIDAAKILLVAHDIRVPHTYRDTLQALGGLGGFDADIAKLLGEFARLRNVLAHEYLDVKFEQIARFLSSAPPVFERFIEFLKAETDKAGSG